MVSPGTFNSPGGGPLDSAATGDAEPTQCDLCGEVLDFSMFTKAAWEASGLYICTPCIEAMLDARADDARSEVGLVGGRH